MIIGSNKSNSVEKIQQILQYIVHIFVFIFLKIFFKFEVQGGEKTLAALRNAREKEKGLLFAPNHISELDAIMVRCALPFSAFYFPMYYVAMTKDHYQYEKFGWRKYFYGGFFFKILGAYPAYLGMRDYQASLINHIELLEHGKSVCIFPEGKISVNTLKPAEVKGGLGFLAEYTQTDIIPVTFRGFERLNWRKILFLQRPKISVIYRDIISIETVLSISKNEGVEEGIQTNKFVSEYVMKKVRE